MTVPRRAARPCGRVPTGTSARLAIALLAAALPVAVPTPVSGQPAPAAAPNRDIAGDVASAARRFGLPEPWIWAVIRAESAGRIDAVSPAGARGLMQLMPATWTERRALYGLGPDPFAARDNILAGTGYLRELYERYGAPGFLAAYNAGPARYEAWRDTGRPLPAETTAYVARIVALLDGRRDGEIAGQIGAPRVQPPLPPSWRAARLFVARADADATSLAPVSASPATSPRTTQTTAQPGGLFVPIALHATP